MSNPRISIICPSYNHEKYVGYFIESVLAQTVQDFELIIVDDCSTDNNVREIEKFHDDRIKLIKHEYNQGINAGLNDAIEHSNGEYLAFSASDDVFEQDYVEKVLKMFDENDEINAVYCNLSVIDEFNEPRTDLVSWFPFVENQPRENFLHTAFLHRNPLYSPGLAFRKRALNYIYPLPKGNVIYQDYRMNVQFLLKGEVLVLPDKLVRYRFVRKNQRSVSTVHAHGNLETDSLMGLFLSITDVNLLKEIFSKEIEETNIVPYRETIEYFLGRMALLSPISSRQVWGCHQIMSAVNDKQDILFKKYNFSFKSYLDLLQQIEKPNDVENIKKRRFLKWLRDLVR